MADEPAFLDFRSLDIEAPVEVRDAAKREIDMRLLPWDMTIETVDGPEEFRRGAFADVNPDRVFLMGMEHEAHMGIGQNGQPVLTRRPTGKATRLVEKEDGPHATFRVARTAAGDEMLALAADGIVTGVSVEFSETPGGTVIERRNGRRVRVHTRVDLRGASLTYRPAYGERAAVLAVRSRTEGEAPMGDQEAPVAGARTTTAVEISPVDYRTDLQNAVNSLATDFRGQLSEFTQTIDTRLGERVANLEERFRADFQLPNGQRQSTRPDAKLHHWASWALRTLMGVRVAQEEVKARALDDIVTTENPGLVPDAFRNDVLGIVQRRRPFLESTTQIAAPESGMSIVVPVISQHATADVQSSEKSEIDSTALQVTTRSFDAVSIFGGADVSIQMIRRADPSFMDLLMQDLGAAYAAKADSRALTALFAAGPTEGTANIDPENLTIGEAWANAMSATGEAPNTIWLSSDGVAAFIDAKSDGSNQPLYFTLNANFTAGGGPGGAVSALRPVYVPQLDAVGSVDVIIGPSSGFAWAEDGNIQLSVDNPTLAGRDIALGGILFFIPRYPAAFTIYDLGS